MEVVILHDLHILGTHKVLQPNIIHHFHKLLALVQGKRHVGQAEDWPNQP